MEQITIIIISAILLNYLLTLTILVRKAPKKKTKQLEEDIQTLHEEMKQNREGLNTIGEELTKTQRQQYNFIKSYNEIQSMKK